MLSNETRSLLRTLPPVEEVLQDPAIRPLADKLPREIVVEAVRAAIDEKRAQILAETTPVRAESANASAPFDAGSIAHAARLRLLALERPSLRRVINASGVIVHTNLGRSVLAPSAVEAVHRVTQGYSTLEYDTETLARGSRHSHCEKLICALTGAEAAIAVNNNAAAVMMVLSEFAAGHEAIVSRGELVEIGGSFRIPDIMALSHAAMVEVGTTNKTHLVDYARAVTPDTAMLLKVHPSNYRMIGFTEHVEVSDLRELADKENVSRETSAANGVALGTAAPGGAALPLLVYEDQGSGAFARMDCFGDYAEPTVAESLRGGCDLVSFSGDKLLGGPQAGIIVGRKELIDRLKKNPLARALRLDKMTLAALEATLRLYLDPDRAAHEIPTLRMLTEPVETVRERAEVLLEAVRAKVPEGAAELSVVDEIARAGGGALPMCDIPTCAVQISFLRGDAQSCDRHLVSERELPVVGRLKREALLLDARTVLDAAEIDEIARAVGEYFQEVVR